MSALGLRDRLRPRRRDVIVTLIVGALDLVFVENLAGDWPGLGVALFGVLGIVPLLWRTRAPVLVFGLVWLHLVVVILAVNRLSPLISVAVVLYAVAAQSSWRTSIVALVISVLTCPLAGILAEQFVSTSGPISTQQVTGIIIGTSALLIVSWALGRWERRRKARIEDLEVSQAAAAAAARAEERKLIALELHDIVSHGVSAMVLQADGARAVLADDPRQADEALEHIGDAGRDAVGELRRLLGVLTEGTLAETRSRGRTPGLSDLPQVVEESSRVGLQTTLEVRGDRPPVPQSFERSVHRIVQESLANSAKHSGPGTAVAVRLIWGPETLLLEIADDGQGSGAHPELSTGFGLAGLRERAAALGGDLETAPLPDGRGFVVTATLPIPPPAPVLDPVAGRSTNGSTDE